jgi:hypothetical protein
MAVLNLDFSNVQSREPLEPGWYLVTVSSIEEVTASTGNPMLKITMDVDSDESGTPIDGNRKLFTNLVLIEKTMGMVKNFMNAIGLTLDDIVTIDTDELIGSQVMVRVVQEMYDGEIRNYTKGFKSA